MKENAPREHRPDKWEVRPRATATLATAKSEYCPHEKQNAGERGQSVGRAQLEIAERVANVVGKQPLKEFHRPAPYAQNAARG